MDKRQIVSSGLVISGRDRPKFFELMEENFDQIALTVVLAVEPALGLAFGLAVDDRPHSFGTDGLKECTGIISSVPDEDFASRVFDERRRHRHFVSLSGREGDVQGPASSVDEGV